MRLFFSQCRMDCGCRWDARNQTWRLCPTHLEDAAREAQEAQQDVEASLAAATPVAAGEEPF